MDMMTDSHSWLHGKRFSVFGDPDFVDRHVPIPAGTGRGAAPRPLSQTAATGGLRTSANWDSPYGQSAEVHVGKDLAPAFAGVPADKPDFLIGNSTVSSSSVTRCTQNSV